MTRKAQQLLAETRRRNAFSGAVEAASQSLFKEQRLAYDSKAKRIVIKAGRRGGKTRTVLPITLRAAAKFPGSIIPVLERTLTCNAAKAFWKNLQAFNDKYDLGIEFRHTVKEATMPNGSRVQIYGVDTLELADKLRGEGFPCVVADECGTFRGHVLSYAVDEAVSAGLMDYDGQIYLVGTPGHRREGYWFDRCHDREWEQHHWTMLDNVEFGQMPYQKTLAWRQAAMAEEILAKGFLQRAEWEAKAGHFLGTVAEVQDSGLAAEIIRECQHPKFLREYMGEWIDHVEALMYEFHPDRNLIDRLPPTDARHPWRYGMGIDLGFNDPTAFTISATREGDPYIYIVESQEAVHMIPSQIAAQIDRYKMAYGHFHFIVGDTGGSGKLAVEEMNRKYGCNIIPAQKTAKLVYVEHLNGDFRTGRIQIVRSTNQELTSNLYALPWNEEKTDADPEYADHLPDSLLYNHRQWNVARTPFGGERKGPEQYSPEWWAREQEADEELGDRLAATRESGWDAEDDFLRSRLADWDDV